MISYIWPIALVILSNVLYHICAKSAPEGVQPFAFFFYLLLSFLFGRFTIGYTIASGILYFALSPQANPVRELGRLNWASFVLGVVIVGLEGGWLYAYKAGWQINTGFIVQSAFVSVMLLFVGYFLYHEALTWNRILGIVICLLGLVFINLK